MFVGHLAVSLGAKAAAPKVPLWTLVAASFGIDLLWPVLLLAGVEVVRIAPGITAFTPLDFEWYPWSHSLLMVGVWGAVAWLATWRLASSTRAAWVVTLVVVSHWALDWIAHRPDLPLWPAGPRFGAGLWNSITGTILFEGGLLIAAVVMFVRAFPTRDRTGTWALAGMLALCGTIWITQPWSPPPPDPMAVAVVGLALWILPPWAAWIERHSDNASET